MKRLIFLLALFIAGCFWFPQGAEASNWVWIDSNDTVSAYLDTDSIRKNGSTATAWVKYANIDGTYGLVKYSFNAEQESLGILSEVDYNTDGSTRNSYTFPPYNVAFQPVVPDSVGEHIYSYIFPL